MRNRRIITYAAAGLLAFSFVSADIAARAYETDEPIIVDLESQDMEGFEDIPQDSKEELIIEQADVSPESTDTDTVKDISLAGTADYDHGQWPGRPGNGGEIKDTTAQAPQIIAHPEALPYVMAGTDYGSPVYTCQAKLPDGTARGTVTFTWYVDGKAAATRVRTISEGEVITDTYEAEELKNLTDYGVHPVYCTVSMDAASMDEQGSETVTEVSNQSMSVNFIVCNGINNHALLTFSDVHEKFSNIGKALDNFMSTDDEGLIPALIVCTGDWHSGHWMGGDAGTENYLNTKNILISRLIAQSGGIDTVFVSGNHENGPAARDANIQADLGVQQDYDGAGVIFDGRAVETDQNNGSSKELKDLIVYGINYENLQTETGISYENIIPALDEYLKDLRSNYAGQLIVISAHAGLHVVNNWGGQANYNIDKSNEMVAMLNKYAEQGMNITFLFGHDHSRRESEMLLRPGDEITSTVSYALKDINEDEAKQTQILKFTYGHSGYITNSIGGHQRYTVIDWTDLRQPDAVITRTLYQLDEDGKAVLIEELTENTGIITAYHFIDSQETYSWQKGEAGITVKADGDFEAVFKGVMVDGKEIDAKDYTAGKGTTIVTLTEKYLSTLESGNHTLKLLFVNDTGINSNVEMTFVVIQAVKQEYTKTDDSISYKSTPNTGVENNVWFWMMAESLSLYAAARIRRKQRAD